MSAQGSEHPTPADVTPDAIGQVLQSILASSAADAAASFEAVLCTGPAQVALAALQADQLDRFYYPFVYPMRQAVKGMVRSVHPSDNLAQFIVEHLDFVELQVKRFITDMEGMACCADKTRWVLRSYLRHSRTGTPIVADRAQQYTYHLPTRVLFTQDDIVEFLRAVMRLFYGHIDAFVATRDRLISQAPAASER